MDSKMKKNIKKLEQIYCDLQKTKNGHKMIKALRGTHNEPLPEQVKKVMNKLTPKEQVDLTDLFLLDCPSILSVPEHRDPDEPHTGCNAIQIAKFPDGRQICMGCGQLRNEKI